MIGYLFVGKQRETWESPNVIHTNAECGYREYINRYNWSNLNISSEWRSRKIEDFDKYGNKLKKAHHLT